jgi:hypothetical protein
MPKTGQCRRRRRRRTTTSFIHDPPISFYAMLRFDLRERKMLGYDIPCTQDIVTRT